MKETYLVEGMSCKGCKTYVEQKLNKVAGVKNAVVNLEKGEAVVEADTFIPFEESKDSLKDSHYSIL
ncbi:MAG: heavy-metal-associated domain-containing protein, partial [Chitinophagaceae bacterium]